MIVAALELLRGFAKNDKIIQLVFYKSAGLSSDETFPVFED